MAEQERRTKAERRAEARAERKRAEEEAQRSAKKKSIRNGIIAAVVIAAIALVMVPTVQNIFGDQEAETTLSQAAALEARSEAGCEMVVENQPLASSQHHDPSTAPPADVMYAESTVRPTHSGPHFSAVNPALGGIPSDPIDERATTHNLEHGAVIVWYDPDGVEPSSIDAMEDWMRARQDMGFESNSGGNVFVSPYEGMTGDKPIAIRAWGHALNCDEWNQDVADAMLIDYWGSHGFAPEGKLSPYPDGALGFGDREVEDNTEAPTEQEQEPETVETDAPTGETTDAPTTDETTSAPADDTSPTEG